MTTHPLLPYDALVPVPALFFRTPGRNECGRPTKGLLLTAPHDHDWAPDSPPADAADATERADSSDAPLTKVDITIAGHTVVVEAHRPMEAVARQALELIRRTAGDARRMPAGFDVGHADTQISDTQIADWEPHQGTRSRIPEPGRLATLSAVLHHHSLTWGHLWLLPTRLPVHRCSLHRPWTVLPSRSSPTR
jgi:hypothetical protein